MIIGLYVTFEGSSYLRGSLTFSCIWKAAMDFLLFLFYSVGYLMYFEGGVSGEPCVTSSATVVCSPSAPHSERWFYESGQCRPFVWLGCGSTDNVFETKYQCDAKCPPQSKSSGEVQLSADGGQSPAPRCDDPVKMGPCEAAIPRFHYVPALRTCQRFLWGGCDPNGNNFLTAEACEEACTDPCRLPGDSGDCEAALPRWYYNPTSRACEVFVYGGCGGNANNFKTRVECENQCAGPLVAGSFRTSPSLCLLGALIATMLLV